MTEQDWRVTNWYLIVGMGGFFTTAILSDHPDRPLYEPVAYYSTGTVRASDEYGGMRFSTNDECITKAQQLYQGRWQDILGSYELPANGIDAPYVFGCQRVKPSGTRMEFWR